jgi:hypothetical protein
VEVVWLDEDEAEDAEDAEEAEDDGATAVLSTGFGTFARIDLVTGGLDAEAASEDN